MPIRKEKQQQLLDEMEKLKIHEDDIEEKFILGSGSGGQKINKSSICVFIHHLPTGIKLKMQKSRQRELNRYYARKLLCEKIAHKIHLEKTEKQKLQEKIRKQKQRRSRKSKAKILEDKKHHSEIKQHRKKPNYED